MKKKLFFDVDNTICNSTKRFVEIYNEIYDQNAEWQKCYKWDFSDICPLAEDVEGIFARTDFYNNQLDFHDPYVYSILKLLYNVNNFDIHFVTIGTERNLYYKKEWLKRRFPYVPDKNYHLLEKIEMGKGEIDMSDGILIDDSYINLLTSNADLKICMHKPTKWNKDVEKSGFKRVENSLELYQYLRELESKGEFNG